MPQYALIPLFSLVSIKLSHLKKLNFVSLVQRPHSNCMYSVFIENNKLLFLEYSTFSILELKGIKAMTHDRFCYYTVVT